MYGLGKKRSEFGVYCDRNGIKQLWLAKESKVSRNTISELCDGSKFIQPQEQTILKIISALRKHGYNVKASDFWA